MKHAVLLRNRDVVSNYILVVVEIFLKRTCLVLSYAY